VTASAATLDAHLRELTERLLIAVRDLPRAVSNMREAAAGYPTSTPGANTATAAAATPEYDDAGEILPPVKLTTVERNATQRDPARIARDRLERLVTELVGIPITELYSLTHRWAYDLTRPNLDPDDADHQWCVSCLRLDRCEPRATDQYKDRCRWCGDFRAAEGRDPSIDLLQKRHDGIRITSAMVTADRQRHRTTVRKKTKKKRNAA
jgi:hypothetical protein